MPSGAGRRAVRLGHAAGGGERTVAGDRRRLVRGDRRHGPAVVRRSRIGRAPSRAGRAVVARAAAAVLWQLDDFEVGEPLAVRIPAGRRAGPAGHRSRRREPGVRVEGWPVTSAAETLVELGAGLSPVGVARGSPRDRRARSSGAGARVGAASGARDRRGPRGAHVRWWPGRVAGARILRAVLDRRPAGRRPDRVVPGEPAPCSSCAGSSSGPPASGGALRRGRRFVARVDLLSDGS